MPNILQATENKIHTYNIQNMHFLGVTINNSPRMLLSPQILLSSYQHDNAETHLMFNTKMNHSSYS